MLLIFIIVNLKPYFHVMSKYDTQNRNETNNVYLKLTKIYFVDNFSYLVRSTKSHNLYYC